MKMLWCIKNDNIIKNINIQRTFRISKEIFLETKTKINFVENAFNIFPNVLL